MNNERRKALSKIKNRIEDIREDIEQLLDEEQECFVGIPENMQNGERYEKSENAISALEEVIENLEDAAENIDAAIEE